MQNISDAFTTKTEFDSYVNQTTGNIDMNRVCQTLSMSIWGLVMAKARATFSLSDLINQKDLKSKYNKMFWMGILIIIAQLFKLSADNSYLQNLTNAAEAKIESEFK